MSGGEKGEECHPSVSELEQFMLGDLSPSDSRHVLAHLLRGCEQCREAVTPLTTAMFLPGQAAESRSASGGAEYDFPIFRALANARRQAATIAQESAAAGRATFPREVLDPEPFLADLRTASDWTLCENLLETCRALRHRDPETMVIAAKMATVLAERIEPERGEAEALADLQARAWAELGNARRVANDPNGAEADIGRALARSGQGTGDPRLLARLMDLTASLYTAQRRFDDALQLLELAHFLYRREGEEHAMGRALIKKGIATGHALDSEQAVQLLAQGLTLLDARQDPKLVLAAVHNLIWFCVDCGRFEEASRLLSESRELYVAHAERLDELKARWMEGRIAAGFDNDEEAEQAFLDVRAGFEEAELSYDAALVSLDLAAVWLRRGRTSDIRSLIDEMLAIFRARNIRREAIGALLMLREAFEKDGATVSLLRNVASELQRLDREPARRGRLEI